LKLELSVQAILPSAIHIAHLLYILLIQNQSFMGSKISGKDLIKLGFPQNNSINIALGYINRYKKREKKESVSGTSKRSFATT
jgi:hypothetical protein